MILSICKRSNFGNQICFENQHIMKIDNVNNLLQYGINENFQSYAEQFPNVTIGVIRLWITVDL